MSLPPPSTFGLPFPSWRPGQAEAIEGALAAPTRFVAIQAPTGSGKSAIAAAIAQLSTRSVILTATKGLQDQYAAMGIPEMADIRGAQNYECLAARDQFRRSFPGRRIVGCDEGPCLVGVCCTRRGGGCCYFDTLQAATRANVVTTNYAYWLSGDPAKLQQRHTALLDEAHAVPEALVNAAAIEISQAQMGTALPHEGATAEMWRAWAAGYLPVAHTRAEQGPVRERHRWKRLATDLATISTLHHDHWAWEWPTAHSARFAPISPALLAERLFQGLNQVVFLSATLTPHTLMALGILPKAVTWITLPSPFPVVHRPIIVYKPAGRVDYRMDSEKERIWLDVIDTLLADRADRKGLLHTVSYRRQDLLATMSRHADRMIVPRHARQLAQAVADFRRAGPGTILVSPALGTGYNFAYGDAEYQIIAKVPFPDTRSPILQARLACRPSYRDELTAQALVQMAGRIVRAADDRGETIITDAHAAWFLTKHQHALAAWFVEAVRLTSDLPAPLPRLRTSHDHEDETSLFPFRAASC